MHQNLRENVFYCLHFRAQALLFLYYFLAQQMLRRAFRLHSDWTCDDEWTASPPEEITPGKTDHMRCASAPASGVRGWARYIASRHRTNDYGSRSNLCHRPEGSAFIRSSNAAKLQFDEQYINASDAYYGGEADNMIYMNAPDAPGLLVL
ncbi:hypothetical protein [Caballeronia grimmiae]|uniref:hypothetical protein n=1 Tax=Caballeronia grimmiae TaxID=1071679 RepID=UPI0038B846A3